MQVTDARRLRSGNAPRVRVWSVPPGVASLAGLVLLVLGWEQVARSGLVPAYILPPPSSVAARWITLAANGVLWHHVSATLTAAVLGFGVACLLGCGLGYALVRSAVLNGVLAPYVASSQAMPVVALAPLLVVWFGLGLLSKVVICVLVVFFPMLVSTMAGLRSIDRSLLDAALTEGASPWQRLWQVEVPLALRTLLGGVKMGLTLAMTGAVVGEFVAADAGLGYLMNFARTAYDAPMVFAASLSMAAIAVAGYVAVDLAERLLIDWD